MTRDAPQLVKMPGFTLVELVVTIMLISILAVTALPRLLSSQSVSAYTLRDELISELRKAQIMALNNADRCYRVAITATGYQLQHFNDTCTGQAVRTESLQAFDAGSSVVFTATGSASVNLDFNNLGQVSPACAGPCLTVSGGDVLGISIESQGYIHDSN
ncbi:type II secretion system protein [Shewanella sp. SNU WT4]|uniref:type II secretion system protein n=1 Tax=Shewanella sp. SNU WT4 TaxID=2590015 RepID=UPI00112DDB8E|nr:type II secretion system protein [Shewanella sp. SNU WT4]QDF68310.1 type II secretion system protein [Shewanella sp. SNU WT4]